MESQPPWGFVDVLLDSRSSGTGGPHPTLDPKAENSSPNPSPADGSSPEPLLRRQDEPLLALPEDRAVRLPPSPWRTLLREGESAAPVPDLASHMGRGLEFGFTLGGGGKISGKVTQRENIDGCY